MSFLVLHREMIAKVDVAYLLVLQNIIRWSFSQCLTTANNIGAVTNTQCLADIMICNQHPDIAIGQMFHNALDIDDRNRINTREKFIQKNKSWFHRQRSRNFHAAPFAA